MTTYNRHSCVERLLNSLIEQKYKKFRLIAGLQEPDERMLSLIERYSQYLNIIVKKISKCGLSSARNKLINYISSDIVVLTDDDCWYPENFTLSLSEYFLNNNIDVCIGVSHVNKNRKIDKSISCYSIFFSAPSWLLFFRSKSLLKNGNFDENIGIGANSPWQSGEETDFVLRIIKNGGKVKKTSNIFVMHPEFTPGNLSKCYGYGRGRIYILRKHNFPFWFCCLNVIYPLFKIPFVSNKLWPYYLTMFKARFVEFIRQSQ